MQGLRVQLVRAEQKTISSAFQKVKARRGVKTKEAKRAEFASKRQEMLRR